MARRFARPAVRRGVVSIRIMGDPDDVAKAVEALRRSGLRIVKVSREYGNRKQPGVRVYVTARV